MYNTCPLYRVQSKKTIKKMLDINNDYWFDNDYVQSKIFPRIEKHTRLVEASSQDLKYLQTKIKNMLSLCEIPNYIYSGVKGRSYLDNALEHKNNKYLFKLDISKFFPNISRERVYHFFKNDLCISEDVSEILTNFCTSNLNRDFLDKESVLQFIKDKKIRHMNHLCTGSPTSQILSYLVNRKMFDELSNLSSKYGTKITVFVDDIYFSSSHNIPTFFRNKVIKIITKYGYRISKNKVGYYDKKTYKRITGVIVTPKCEIDVPNKLRSKVKYRLKENKLGIDNLNQLSGCVSSCKYICKDIYPNISNYIKEKRKIK